MKRLILILFLAFPFLGFSQFTKQDSLRGTYGPSRDWWNILHVDLTVDFDIKNKTITGKNAITFEVIKDLQNPVFQLDLQQPMFLDSVVVLLNDQTIRTFSKSELKPLVNAYLLNFGFIQKQTTFQQLQVIAFFHGSPIVAINPPWDGGIIWTKDNNAKDWVSIACQGLGSSVWYPCKDSQFDEPEKGANMHFSCPKDLVCVSNGRLLSSHQISNDKTMYNWEVKNPINNYLIIPYIGDYIKIEDPYQGKYGKLDVTYWVLRQNENIARKHLHQSHKTIEAFENYFGPYPFYEDSYKLVESPYLGMEHQSAIAYGNLYQMGYLGSDISYTGYGLNWDYIIVHESGHEWFGNNITTKDIADMWVHESFTTYSEVLYVEFTKNNAAANEYCKGLRGNISNDVPIIGKYDVNNQGSGDMYYKGANLIHTIRQICMNDSLFFEMLRQMNKIFYHQTVTSAQIEAFMIDFLQLDLKPLFDQYLRATSIPVLNIKRMKNQDIYYWTQCNDTFNMPIRTDKGLFKVSTKKTALPKNLLLNDNQYYLLKQK